MQLRTLASLIMALIALDGGVAAQAASSSSSNITDILGALPVCALACMQTTAQTANCSLADTNLLAGCLCPNGAIQYSFATCVEMNCTSLSDQVAAFHVESQDLCGAYPKASKQRLAINVSIVTLCLSIPIVAARIYARLTLTKRLWADDYMSIFTLFALVALAAMEIFGSQKGIGVHYWDLDFGTDFKNVILIRQILYAARMFYPLIQCTGKVAILLLFQRVFDVGHQGEWFSRTIKVCIGLLFAGEFIFIFLIAFQCLPIAAIWDKTITNAKCLNLDTAYLIGAVLTIGADLVLIVLPVPALRKLQIGSRKRTALIIVFAIASFGIVASLVRIKYLIVEGTNVNDLTWYYVDVHNWTLIDLLAIVICGCLPALWPYLSLLVPYFPALISRKKTTTNQSKSAEHSSGGAASRYSVAVSGPGRKASVASYSLTPLSSKTPTGMWREVPDIPTSPRLPPRALTREEADLRDIEAANLPGHTITEEGVLSNESQDDLITVPHAL